MPNSITILFDAETGEYLVPGPEGKRSQVSVEPDLTSAEFTALATFGADVVISVARY